MALTTSERGSSPYADLHVKPYAERHVKVYADSVGRSACRTVAGRDDSLANPQSAPTHVRPAVAGTYEEGDRGGHLLPGILANRIAWATVGAGGAPLPGCQARMSGSPPQRRAPRRGPFVLDSLYGAPAASRVSPTGRIVTEPPETGP
jgi:hypothetical protein